MKEALEAWQLAKARSIQTIRELAAIEAMAEEKRAELDVALFKVEVKRFAYEWRKRQEEVGFIH